MPTLLWDASGLAKRYALEAGTATINAIFAAVPLFDMVITPWGYLETYAILRRRYNSGVIDAISLSSAVTSLQSEVIVSGDFNLVPISDHTIFEAASLVDAHNLNSADAVILAAYLSFQARLPFGSPPCVLVASDKRLLCAAGLEGLSTLNPETLGPSDIPAFFASL